ncbi:MAG: hypothetical protein JWR84_2872 [Caulobacter sp.]|nr:hypothetical protein [Caulobacter sp.]
MSGERQTVAGAYMKIAAHEELCAERYRGINEKLSWVLRSLVGMLLALLAWALVQLYALEPLRSGRLELPITEAPPHQARSQVTTSSQSR